MAKIIPKDLSIRELLGADSPARYAVPKYQREFEWKKEQAEEMWEDISNGKTFLGTLVLNNSQVNTDGTVTIVDGQQRLTTISILLAACRVKARELENGQLANEIQRKLSFVDDTTGSSKNSKLVVSKYIRELYDLTIANSEWKGGFEIRGKKRQSNRLKPIYHFFYEKIQKSSITEITKLLDNLYGSNFVAIYIDSDEDAFEIFERTNARGLELNAAELLKNFFFSEEISDELEELWDEIIELSNGNIIRLIKYYYVSKNGYIQKKGLYPELKKIGIDTGAKELFNDLRDFSIYYDLITTGIEVDIKEWAAKYKIKFFQTESNQGLLHTTLSAISLFKTTQIYPLLIALIRNISDKKNKEQGKHFEGFINFIQTIEKFLFINYAISQNPGNQIEVYFADKCEELAKNNDVLMFMNEIKKDLRKKRVGKGEFSEKFEILSYENNKPLIYYFFDRINNFDRKSTERIKIYNPDHKILRKNYDCDHFVPQNYTKSWPKEENLDEVIHSIGNMLVIARHTNGSMNDLLPEKKFTIINERQNHLPYIPIFVKEWSNKNWSSPKESKERIKERISQLKDLAFDKIWDF